MDILWHNLATHPIQDIDLIFFDTETSGNTDQDQVIQISACKFSLKHQVETKFSRYISLSNNRSIHEEAIAVHGITPEFLAKNGKPAKDVYRELKEFCGRDFLLIAHNAPFDTSMCSRHSSECDMYYLQHSQAVLDTHILARSMFFDSSDYKLDTLLEYFDIEGRSTQSHDALEDCVLGVQMTRRILNTFKALPLSVLLNRFRDAFCNDQGKSGLNYQVEHLSRVARKCIKNDLNATIMYCKNGQAFARPWSIKPVEIKQDYGNRYLIVSPIDQTSKTFTLRLDRIFDIQPKAIEKVA